MHNLSTEGFTRSFYTISGSSRFIVSVRPDLVVVLRESSHGRKITAFKTSKLYDLIDAVEACGIPSTRIYSPEIKGTKYLLPVALYLILDRGGEPQDFLKPKVVSDVWKNSTPDSFELPNFIENKLHTLAASNGCSTTRWISPYRTAVESRLYQSSVANPGKIDLELKEPERLDNLLSTIALEQSARTEQEQGVKSELVVPIYYGTERQLEGIDHLGIPIYGSDSSNELSYGKLNVRIPDNHKFGRVERFREQRWIMFLRNGKDGFTSTEHKFLQIDELSGELSSGDDENIIIFIHGYNNSFEDAIFRAAQLKYDLQFSESIVSYSWACHGKFWGYFKDESHAKIAGKRLADMINELGKSTDKKISIIAHSMGAYCLANSLKNLSVKLDKVVLLAADICQEQFTNIYGVDFTRETNNTTIYAAKSDRALKAAKLFRINPPRVGQISGDVYCYDSIDTVDVSAHGHGRFIKHNYGLACRIVLDEIHRMLILNAPISKRTLKRRSNSFNKTYWYLSA